MDKITLLDKTFVKYISEKEIEEATERMARQINEDYKNDQPVLLVTLNGAIVFAVELMKKLTMRCRISCVKLSSYSGTSSTGAVKINKDLNQNIEGRHLILVEDILDSGVTLNYLRTYLQVRQPASVSIVTLMDKPGNRKAPVDANYACFDVPDAFVVGYGLDYNERYRNLPYIGILSPEVYSK